MVLTRGLSEVLHEQPKKSQDGTRLSYSMSGPSKELDKKVQEGHDCTCLVIIARGS